MKKYRIDNQLLYNPEDRSLVRIDDDLSRMVLTHISNRLFCLFLDSDGSVIPRDIILQKVWDEHSLTASGSNLNNYISSLRKQLTALGLERPLIITEPKMGFRIDAERVVVEVETLECTSNTPTVGREMPQDSTSIIPAATTTSGVLKGIRLWLVSAIVTGVVALCLWALITTFHAASPRQISGLQYVFSENGCSFYTPENSYSRIDVDTSRRVVLSLVKKHSVLCSDNGIVIYDLFGVLNNNIYSGRALIAGCKTNRDSIERCESHFIYSVREHE